MTDFGIRLALGAVLACGSALPALAQAGLCGGVGDTGQWLGGDEAMSDIATAGTFLEQTALVLMNTEYVGLFALTQDMQVRIEAEAQGMGDTVIDIRDASGAIVASDDDSGGNAASRTEPFLAAGNYCISMRSYDGGPLTGFVRVGRLEHEALTDGFVAMPEPEVPFDDPYAPGSCDIGQMVDIGGGQPIDAARLEGGLSVSAAPLDTPYVGFTLAEPLALTVTATNEMADPRLIMFDSYGYYFSENDDWDGLNSRMEFTYPLEAGTYCMTLAAWNDESLPIEVALTAYDAVAAMMGMYDRGEAAPPLDGSYPVTMLGPISQRLRQDLTTGGTVSWFALDVPQAGLLVIDAVTGQLGDPTLVLFDDLGRQIAYNDDNGETLDSRITARVWAGTYLLGVRQLGSVTTEVPTRLLIERWVPAE
jgi:hypothetical protein